MRLPSKDDLHRLLLRLDGRGYKAYKDLKGRWDLEGFELEVQYVQGDPFADPSRVTARVDARVAGLPKDLIASEARRLGIASLLARRFRDEAHVRAKGRGSGSSGRIRIAAPAQEVLPQTAVQVHPDGSLEARFGVGLPAKGRRVLGGEAVALLLADVPAVIEASLLADACDPAELVLHAETNEDADALREALGGLGLVAFVADGALLPRRSGIQQEPLDEGAVPFESPPELRVQVQLPNAGPVTGAGIPKGVTLIVGGGYHGKSTLLDALERGVYNHRPRDGRERVVAEGTATKVRAEDGRSVTGVDISPFIGTLPLNGDTTRFSSTNASGSTSQAAAIVEAIEAGARTLLIDEDTAATNFMIRDRRMQALVPGDLEPITPFVDRVRWLHAEVGVSTVVVLGGSGDYLDVADTVVAMRHYEARDVTAEAKDVARRLPTGRTSETAPVAVHPSQRAPLARSLDPSRGRRPESVKVRGAATIEFGSETINLATVEQIVAPTQLRAIARGLLALRGLMDGCRTLPDLLDAVDEALESEGLDTLDHRRTGDLALFRRIELAAALNRLRGLELDPDCG